ncbi:hypothetical protein FO519_008342 [Halicephalobus sp. NKZ332]|nr:hypothetical protein FO519_008342 [Halicephalobus sp. NKZ332]
MAMASTSKLPPLPALRDFIHMYRLRAKKILSQNYLMDMNLTRKVSSCSYEETGFDPGAHVVEIGPGPGGITRAILENDCRRLDVVEIDHRFIPPLEHLAEASEGRLVIHQGDVLKTDLGLIFEEGKVIEKRDWFEDFSDAHIVGNLPFNIASPLVVKFLREMSRHQGPWKFGRIPLTLTFQLEVAKRLCGEIDSDFRSRLSIVTQFVSEPKLLFVIPGSCFVPKPEIDVGVVKFVPRIEPLIPCDFALVEKVARQLFIYRRKYVIKCLRTLYPENLAEEMVHDLLRNCRINPTTTAFRLGIEEIGPLCLFYEKQCRELPGLFLFDRSHRNLPLEELSKNPGALPPSFVSPAGIPNKELDEGISLTEFIKGQH